MRFVIDAPDLIKSRAHKYVKRTGSPGNYKYWYKMPDGTLKADDDKQSQGRIDHIKRLLLAHRSHAGTAGHHSMDHETIKRMTNAQGKEFATAKKYVDRIKRYNRAGGQQWNGRHFDHDYDPEHLSEAHIEQGEREESAPASNPREEYERQHGSHWTQDREARGDFMPKGADGRTAGAAGNVAPDHLSRHVTGGIHKITKRGDKFVLDAYNEEGVSIPMEFNSLREAVSRSEQLESAAREARSREAEPAPAPRPRRTRRPRAAAAAPAPTPTERAAESTSGDNVAATLDQVAQEAGASNSQSLDKQEGESNEQYQQRLMAIIAGLGGPDFRQQQAAPAPAQPEVQTMPQRDRARVAEMTARRNREVGPRSEGATALAEAAPDFAAADQPIARMEAVEARGGNPYLARAKEIYHNIQHDLKPERRETAKHLLQAIDSFGSGPITESALLQKYKEISGRSVRGLSGISEEFEKATFMTLEEVIENKPLDIEVERMKRGYAAKQFARMKPFLKEAWKNANPSAPPPMPTFGDIKSWTEHGSKPGWAGTTRLAMPQEVFDAAHKGADGKPKYPPAWMPIHMMPVWNYMMKKAGDDSPYQTRNVNIQNGRLNLGNQAAFQEGMIIAGLRKYVQMRGGADQLVDIPSSKLQEVGLSHSDIFKASFKQHDLSDGTIKKMLQHKIFDPVALVPFIDEELKASGTQIKKSFSLVIDGDAKAFDFRKSYVIEDQSLKKSLIEKIKRLRSEKGLDE